MQRVERGEIALARNAEDVIDAVESQLIDKDLAAGAGGRCHGRLVYDKSGVNKKRRALGPPLSEAVHDHYQASTSNFTPWASGSVGP